MDIQVTRTEQAKYDFVSGLMGYNSTGIGPAMVDFYETNKRKLGPNPDLAATKALMNQSTAYKFGAFFEFNDHAMMFETVLGILEKQKDEVIEWLDTHNEPGALGSLSGQLVARWGLADIAEIQQDFETAMLVLSDALHDFIAVDAPAPAQLRQRIQDLTVLNNQPADDDAA